MTTDATDPHSASLVGNAARRLAAARVGRVPVLGLLAAFALVALIGAAYNIGTPSPPSIPGGDAQRKAAPAAPSFGGPNDGSAAISFSGAPDSQGSGTGANTTPQTDPLTASLESTQIVKTGSMALEVSDLDKAVSQAQSTIVGIGGYVSQSSSSGDKAAAVATFTYRLPAARWEDALSAMRGLASRVIAAQTDSTDVTAQVIDLDARLSNLRSTQSALQSIMTRATAIPDVLAVEQQLSQTEGEIEQLTAQRDHLKDQAAVSTLSVSFSTPTATVTTQATREWDLGAQVDEAAATLVHIGQGLATIAVWAVIVGLPILVGLALLGGIWWAVRRITRRRGDVASAA